MSVEQRWRLRYVFDSRTSDAGLRLVGDAAVSVVVVVELLLLEMVEEVGRARGWAQEASVD